MDVCLGREGESSTLPGMDWYALRLDRMSRPLALSALFVVRFLTWTLSWRIMSGIIESIPAASTASMRSLPAFVMW